MVQVFKYEERDGLANQLNSDLSIALILDTSKIDILAADQEKLTAAINSAEQFVKQVDLFYFECVLASVGWNKNDDVFDKAEIWTAKETPINKKINYMHDETDIIGHMIRSFAFDNDNKAVGFELSTEQIPNNFNLMVGGVLYKFWEKPELQNRMHKILAEVAEGKWKVSMECLFPHFDYAIVTPVGEHKIIARNEQTSFLTKYLRRYGGTGEFDGYKVGRLLRKITFSGNALVTNPANPQSIITKTEINTFNGVAASADILPKVEKIMEFTQAQYDEIKVKLEKAEAALKDVADRNYKQEIDGLKSNVKELETAKATLDTQLAASKDVVKAHEDKAKLLETELATVKADLVKATEQLTKINKETTKAKRLALFNDIEVDATKAKELVDKFAEASDEIFEELVKAMPKKKANDVPAPTPVQALATAKLDTESGSPAPESKPELTTASTWISNIFRSTEKKSGDK